MNQLNVGPNFIRGVLVVFCVLASDIGTALASNRVAGGSAWGEPIEMTIPPWQGEYKLTPLDTDRLTAADIVGPDGVVYPNWRNVGVQGGIPEVPVVVRLKDLGATQLTDISALIMQASDLAAAAGGGAILIDPGVYYLDELVTITHSNVVLRGHGRDRTRLVFRYSLVNPNAIGLWAAMTRFPQPAAIFFQGGNLEGYTRALTADGKRGDTVLAVDSIDELSIGDRILLRAAVTTRWQESIYDQSRGAWGTRTAYYEIRGIDPNSKTITINQPLRIDYPVIDESSVWKMDPIERCGVESMTIEHTDKLPIHTVCSQWAWNCWVRDVTVLNSGRSGVHWHSAKWCEIRDSEFDSCWNHGGGGVGYGGFTQSADCLMDNCLWINYRHAPIVQFGAQGNVFRNSTFEGSDAQWHGGWATENLFENCSILPSRKNFDDPTPRYLATNYGSYGFGMFSSASHTTSNGPNGPRNVVYNCDVISDKDGVYGRGGSENWIFIHNRFQIQATGAGGFYAESGFFDAIIRNNVFFIKNITHPMLYIRTEDCVGIELIDNTVYSGSEVIVDGVIDVAVDSGNRAHPLPLNTSIPDRPLASPTSIYDWQKTPGPPELAETLYQATHNENAAREIVLYWQSNTDETYTIEYSNDLLSGFTETIGSDIQATPPTNVYIHKLGDKDRWFYRLVSNEPTAE
ncbi:MAG: right-handed parallel beta-helix repeat-containing protein [Verrucomicrobiota bacterium]